MLNIVLVLSSILSVAAGIAAFTPSQKAGEVIGALQSFLGVVQVGLENTSEDTLGVDSDIKAALTLGEEVQKAVKEQK